MLLGIVYIPPESSPYSSVSIFNDTELDILNFLECKEYQVALIGDFNARCGNLLDFVRFDDPIMEVLGLEQVDRNELFNECTLETRFFN